MLSAFYLLFSKKKKEERVEKDEKEDVLQPRYLGLTSTFTLMTKTIKMLKVNQIWAK